MELDPGGIGKGYAVDCMVDVLRRRGFQIALVAGSDSTIYGMGAPPTEPKGWRVGIKDPRNTRRTVAEVFLKDMSLSTSGSYEKFFRAEGRIYAISWTRGRDIRRRQSGSVSVIAPRTIDSEAWAKPYFINGRQWTERHKPKEFRVCFCEGRAEQPCAWLLLTGTSAVMSARWCFSIRCTRLALLEQKAQALDQAVPHVANVLQTLRAEMRRSLTYDHGKKMAQHQTPTRTTASRSASTAVAASITPIRRRAI